jgi:tRNA threonylcarbamoyladenosine biosynthesis protein TsaE
MEFVSKNLEDTQKLASDFLSKIKKGDEATVVALSGELGSGKTAFVKCVASLLGIKEEITSPTFVIQKRYKLQVLSSVNNIPYFKNLIHMDVYRLKNESELGVLGFAELLKDSDNLIFVEWPEIVEESIPGNAYKINFEFIDENTRKLTF